MRSRSASPGYRPFVVASILLLGLVIWSGVGQQDQTTLQVGDTTFETETVVSESDQQRGLSGRISLPADKSMLFVYNQEARRCFWMKDMRFAIDIVWLDTKKRVIAVEQNVQPSTYPTSFCYDNARYVVEFTAGTVERLRLNPGDVFRF